MSLKPCSQTHFKHKAPGFPGACYRDSYRQPVAVAAGLIRSSEIAPKRIDSTILVEPTSTLDERPTRKLEVS